MPSDECPCPNTWVCALIFYFRMETVGGDSGDCQASCHRVRCEVWGVRCEVWGGDSRERYQAELDWLRMTGGAAAARKCPTLSVPLRFPRGQLFSRSFPSFPSALRQSRHSAYFLTPFHHWLTAWWLVWSYYKAITTPTPPPPPVKSGYPLTSNLSLEPTDWSSQYLRKEGWRRSVSRAVFLPARNHIWIKSYRADS